MEFQCIEWESNALSLQPSVTSGAVFQCAEFPWTRISSYLINGEKRVSGRRNFLGVSLFSVTYGVWNTMDDLKLGVGLFLHQRLPSLHLRFLLQAQNLSEVLRSVLTCCIQPCMLINSINYLTFCIL